MMGTKKRVVQSSPSTPAQMKFRSFPEVTRATAKGTKPLPDPISVCEILTKVVVHCCKRVLFMPPRVRLTFYAILFFFVSLVTDYMPLPKTYFGSSDNAANQYFVKFSWAWTFSLVGIFMFLTSSVYCAGDRRKMLKQFSRLAVGTVVWYVWTNIFSIIEESTGQCVTPEGPVLYSVRGKRLCSSKNGKWTASFDISGHAFLLTWCVLFIVEETKAIQGWDSIRDHIRKEDHNRRRQSISAAATDVFPDTPLNGLAVEQFEKVKENYGHYAVIANVVLVLLTALVLLWDIMMIFTALYFHSMLEKFIGALIATLMWHLLYHGVYKLNIPVSPGLPGVGVIRYTPLKTYGSLSSGVPVSDKSVPNSSPQPGAIKPRQ